MEKQNVTLSLPKALIKKAKTIAAKQEKSLSELMRESLEEKVEEESRYKKAKEKQLRLLNTGFDLGTEGNTSFKRDDIYERQ